MVDRRRFLLASACAAPLFGAGGLVVSKPNRIGRIVENEHFIADLSERVVGGRPEDAGTIRALTYKPFGVKLFRTRNRMHWAPNFRRAGADKYHGIGVWHPVQEFSEDQTSERYRHWRKGYVAAYPEILVEAEYRFFPAAPYFLFHSIMTVEQSIAVDLLRNNEMTMDSFFTHVAWPDRSGRQSMVTFDERHPLLGKEPIAPDAPWVAFLNLEQGYAYGAVCLKSSASKTANSQIVISDGFGGGKYWHRWLIGDEEMTLESGDRFEELTAFVLFRCSGEEPLSELTRLEAEIRGRWG